MGLVVRKVQGGAEDRIRSLVAEHAQSLEAGLSVLETSLRLGRTTIDVVALDAKQTLVLVVSGEVADEKMLIGTLDAYVWCLTHPESVQRRYPAASIAITRPPRIIFVAERIPEPFMELVERLSVVPVECQELHIPSPTQTPTPPAPAKVETPTVTPAPSQRLAPAQIAAWLDAGLAQQRGSSAPAMNGHSNGQVNGSANGHAPLAASPAPRTTVPPAPPVAPVQSPAKGAAKPATPPAPEAANHPVLESLKFPKGGVSRQWQDFLDQLAAANK